MIGEVIGLGFIILFMLVSLTAVGFLIADKNSRVASEVFVAGKHVIVGGEVASKNHPDYTQIVKDALIKIGYDGKSDPCPGLLEQRPSWLHRSRS